MNLYLLDYSHDLQFIPQMIKRERFSKIPTQGNYYPLAAAGYIEDERVRMTIVTGQPLGAASMSSGQFEVNTFVCTH